MFPFEVDPTSDLPLWVQLRNRIAYLINDGTLAPGDKLPTVRGLASEVSVNYNTVSKAYLSLASDGYIESVRGRGAFVRIVENEEWAERAGEVDGVIDDCIQACLDMGLSLDDFVADISRRVRKMKLDADVPARQGAGKVIRLDMGADAADAQAAPAAKTGA